MARAGWQDLYVIEQTSSMTEVPTFATSDCGIEGGVSSNFRGLLPLTGKPNFNIGRVNELHQRVQDSSVQYTSDYLLGSGIPGVTLDLPVNNYSLSLFAWLLFQSGAVETLPGALRRLICNAYTSSTVSRYAAIMKVLDPGPGNSDDQSHYLTGCIAKSITLNGEEGGLLTASVELIGTEFKIANNDLTTPAYNTLIFSTTSPHLFQSLDFTINGSAVRIKRFNVTVNNNATSIFFDDYHPSSVILGMLDINGSFSIAWGDPNYGDNSAIEDFLAGNDALLDFQWDVGLGFPATQLTFNAVYMGPAVTSDIELLSDITFSGATDLSANPAIRWTFYYGSTALKRDPTS